MLTPLNDADIGKRFLECTIYPPVKTKHDFVRRYEQNEFGNRAPTWNTYEEWYSAWSSNSISCPKYQLYHIRNRKPGGQTFYNQEGLDVVLFFTLDSTNHKDWYISCMCPTKKTLIQGEIQQGVNGLEMFYTCIPEPMRDALKIKNESVSGVRCTQLLRYYMCPNSYEWLQVLLDRYPEHVVEFSTFSVNWGTLPNFNTVYWECRLY